MKNLVLVKFYEKLSFITLKIKTVKIVKIDIVSKYNKIDLWFMNTNKTLIKH